MCAVPYKEAVLVDVDKYLVLGGIIAVLAAVLHIVVLIGGPDWIAYVKAPASVVESARRGTWLAPVSILAITGIIIICALYAFSGAGLLPKLPLLGYVLTLIGGLCLLRGLLLVPIIVMRPALLSHLGAFDVASSLVFVVMGAAYAAGAYRSLTAG
jgi:hypothetical protein